MTVATRTAPVGRVEAPAVVTSDFRGRLILATMTAIVVPSGPAVKGFGEESLRNLPSCIVGPTGVDSRHA